MASTGDTTVGKGGGSTIDLDELAEWHSILPPICPSKANAQTVESYRVLCEKLHIEEVPSWAQILANNPPVLDAYVHMVGAVSRTGNLPRLMKELIIFAISHRLGSPYCIACHAHAALNLDTTFTLETLVDLCDGQGSDAIKPQWRAGIDFALKTITVPHAVTQADRDGLIAEGFSDADIVELATTAGLAMLFNHMTMSLKPSLEDNYVSVLEGLAEKH